MKTEVEKVKGFEDYLPPESQLRSEMKKIIERTFQTYGFLPIETPVLEYEELMSSSENENDEAVSDRYKLTDKGNRQLGMRYEFTFQLARIMKENPNIKLPFKRYQIGENFRDEPTRKGRMRQFTQRDVDIVGDSSVLAEAECIGAVCSALKELNIETVIQVNNRKLLNSIIESVQISGTQQILRELDKLEKIGEEQTKSNLKKLTSTNQVITLFRLLEKDLEFFKQNGFDGAKELEDLIDLLKTYGIKTKFSPTMVRGFAYYTGNIFEAILPEKNTSIAGGGRYDKTIGRFLPREIPAVGFSFSLEALQGLCSEQLKKLKLEPYPKVLLISIGQDEKTLKIAKELRKNKISCTIESGKPSKALDYANVLNIPYVIFIGAEEISQKKFKLKDMKSGKEVLVQEKQLIKKLEK